MHLENRGTPAGMFSFYDVLPGLKYNYKHAEFANGNSKMRLILPAN